MTLPKPELRILYSRSQIVARIAEMAEAISLDLQGEAVILIGVLKGAVIFMSDLARSLRVDVSFDFIGVSSYGKSTRSSGEVRLTKDLDQSLAGKNVILVEDILDSGLTLAYLKQLLNTHHPKSLRIATLLDKPSRRSISISADYVGFTIGDQFVVGYGMDYSEQYRNLPDICTLFPPPE